MFSHSHHHLEKPEAPAQPHDTDPSHKHTHTLLFRVINNERSFACYIMKEVRLQSGVSGLTFDPDTGAMFHTSKSSLFQLNSILETTVFFHRPSPSLSRQPRANLTPSKVTWAILKIEASNFLVFTNLLRSEFDPVRQTT